MIRAFRVLTTIGSFSDDQNLPYVAMIPVESTMVKQSVFESELEERMSYMDLVVNATKARRSVHSIARRKWTVFVSLSRFIASSPSPPIYFHIHVSGDFLPDYITDYIIGG
jgi:hypothetical protein